MGVEVPLIRKVLKMVIPDDIIVRYGPDARYCDPNWERRMQNQKKSVFFDDHMHQMTCSCKIH